MHDKQEKWGRWRTVVLAVLMAWATLIPGGLRGDYFGSHFSPAGIARAAAFSKAQASDATNSFRFVVLADSRGTGPGDEINRDCLQYIVNQIINLNPKPNLVFFLGDMVKVAYNQYLHRLLPDWIAIMQPISDAGIQLYVAIGNHELYDVNSNYDSALQEEFQAFFSNMPSNGPTAYNKLAYYVEFRNSFFIVLDTFGFKSGDINWDNGIDELQYYWFYAEALRSQAKHKFLLTHGPAFSTEGWSVDQSMKNVWQVMKETKFDIYFCGHEHIYSRWNPDDSSLVQVITGSAGAKPDSRSLIKVDPLKAHINLNYNFVVMDIEGDRFFQQAFAVLGSAGSYTTVKVDSFNNVHELNGVYLMLLDP